ncbi:hypothetical protein TRVL_03758 [Trypanosoma vivax]|nr:hypothetical protein TRVL_03758 [Trypanosoma vivax]
MSLCQAFDAHTHERRGVVQGTALTARGYVLKTKSAHKQERTKGRKKLCDSVRSATRGVVSQTVVQPSLFQNSVTGVVIRKAFHPWCGNSTTPVFHIIETPLNVNYSPN